MSIKQDSPFANGNNCDICIGLNRDTDERSLQIFLDRFSDVPLIETLIPRLSDKEIINLFDQLSGLLHRHLSHQEYHSLFLKDRL